MALAMHNAFTVAFMIAIVPAITVLYFTLKRYERYLNDKHLFFSIITGLFLGILVSVFHLAISASGALTGSIFNFVLIIISFAIFENIVKVVFVQLSRFERKFEVTFYGATFGLILGSSITMGRTYAIFSQDIAIYDIIGIGLFAVAILFMNGGMGAYIGYGHHKSDMRWTMISAVFISMPFNLFLFLWYTFQFYWPGSSDNPMLVAIAMVYGVGVFIYMYNRVLPAALPLKHKRELLKEARKKYK
jgi:membrane-associated HD superfamily phosphohydrolase